MSKSKAETETNTLLVTTDFSDCSKNATAYAAKLALCLDLSLTLLHVIHDPASAPGYYFSKHSKKHLKKMSDVATDMMDDFVLSLLKESVEFSALQNLANKKNKALIHPVLITGLPVPRILEMIEKLTPEMVVMGRRGHNTFSEFILGSKAGQILRLSPVSVTIVK